MNYKKTGGFTLIELMVVMLVIVLAVGGALPSYYKFNESQSVANDSRKLLGELSKAKSVASSLKYPSGCTNFIGVNVVSDVPKTGLRITTQCASGNFTETLTGLMTAASFTAPLDITFLPGSGYLSSGTDVVIVISDTKTPPNTVSITVGNYGLINVL